MKRWSIPAEATTADGLVLEDAAAPEPAAGQVLLRVRALSINARDQMVLDATPFGRTPGADLVPLSDVAATVEAVGEGVKGWEVGDRVTTAHVPSWTDGHAPLFGPGPGSGEDPGRAAELVVVDADALVASPDHLDDAEASTLQVAGVTAWNALFGSDPVRAGDTVVVIGAGGVSLFAAQLAVAAGASVVAAVRSGADDPVWGQVGAQQVVTTEQGWGQRVQEATGGAAKVVNTVGPAQVAESLAALRPGGEVAVPGLKDMGPAQVDITTMIATQTSLRGVAVGSVAMHRDLSAFLAEHAIHPVIQRRLAFQDLPQAYDAPPGGHVVGKTVVDVA